MTSQTVVLLCLATAALWAQTEGPSADQIIRRSLDRDHLNTVRASDYTYTQRVERRELDSRGATRRTESDTFDVIMIGERPYSRKIAHNDRPLSAKDAARAQRDFDREIRKRQQENPGERARRRADEEKRRQESRAFLVEIPEAFFLKLSGVEPVDGHPAWVIEAEPRPGYKGKVKHWELLKKFKGRIWVDQQEYQWVRVEAESIAPVSFGWILARLDKGARLTFHQARVNSEDWLPVRATTHVDARVGLIKKFRADIDVTWKDYRKFRTDTRILPAGETPASPSSPPK